MCTGHVGDEAAARAALVARARGAGVVVTIGMEATPRRRFLEDLEKLGPVAAAPPAGPLLSPVQQELLARLAAGATVTDAAAELSVSRRTANRLLADARTRLGVDTTAEAVLRGADGLRGR